MLERDAPFEPPIITLAEQAVFVFCLCVLFTADREHAIGKINIDILLIEAWQLGYNFDLFVCFGHFDVRP